jgi:hypothetical protein
MVTIKASKRSMSGPTDDERYAGRRRRRMKNFKKRRRRDFGVSK